MEGKDDYAARTQRTVLFCPINSAGHMNASLAIADRLKQEHNYRSVFLLIGPPLNESIERHGHELVVLEDLEPYEDYELEVGEDPDGPADEAQKRRAGKKKKRFVGALKWPAMIARNQAHFRGDPIECHKHTSSLVHTITLNNLRSHEAQIAREIFEKVRPDLIVADIYLPPACILINEHRCPWVRIHTANPMALCKNATSRVGSCKVRPPANCGFKLYTRAERQRMARRDPRKWASILREWSRAHEEISQVLTAAYEPVRAWYASQSENLAQRLKPGMASISSPHLNVYMYPEALDYDREDDLFEYPARWLRCDSLVIKSAGDAEAREEQRWRQLLNESMRNKDALVYFSLGSIASANVQLMKRYVNFLGGDDDDNDVPTTSSKVPQQRRRLYVVSKGVNGDKYELPGCNMIGERYVPQTLLLKRANLAIIHGGNNTITECLYYGVPMIVLPNFNDQLDNAQRVEDLGLGKRLDLYKCKKDELLQTISALLADRRKIERVRAISKRMQELDELGKVSDVISSLVERGYLDETTCEKYEIKRGI